MDDDFSTSQQDHAREEGSKVEKCPICLATTLIDPSIPGGCGNKPGHVYCFSCLRTWFKNNASCPLCGLQSTFIRHLLTLNGGAGVIEPLEKLKSEFLQEKIKEESERIPLDEEKQLLRKYLHSLNRILNTRDEEHERSRKYGRNLQRWLERRARLVQCITRVRSLIESCERKNISRQTLNADPVFRGMIYEYQLLREDVSPNEQRRNYNPTLAREEQATNPSRIRKWLRREVPIAVNMTYEDERELEDIVKRILEGLREGHINAPEFEKLCRRCFKIRDRSTITTFCNELFDFASSNYDINMFLQNSRYRARPDFQGGSQSDFQGGSQPDYRGGTHRDSPTEIVDLDEQPMYDDNDVEVIGEIINL